MKKIILLFVTCTLLFACRNKVEKSVATNKVKVSVDTLSYNYDSVVVYSKYIIKNNGGSDTTKASVTYPVFKNDSLNTYLRNQVTDYIAEEEKNTTYDYIAKSFVKGYDSYFMENKVTNEFWFLTIDINVVYQKPNYIALQYMNSDYSGGAHPNTNFSFLNYDPKKNIIITIDSLFDGSNKTKLIALAEGIFRKNEKLGDKEDFDGKYFFENGKFSIPENFYINDNGLVFHYNPYEIKAYAYGITEITIPFSALKAISKPNTILSTQN